MLHNSDDINNLFGAPVKPLDLNTCSVFSLLAVDTKWLAMSPLWKLMGKAQPNKMEGPSCEDSLCWKMWPFA